MNFKTQLIPTCAKPARLVIASPLLGDFLASVNIQDAYLCIAIFPRFAVGISGQLGSAVQPVSRHTIETQHSGTNRPFTF